jgi:hypothetical protein
MREECEIGPSVTPHFHGMFAMIEHSVGVR